MLAHTSRSRIELFYTFPVLFSTILLVIFCVEKAIPNNEIVMELCDDLVIALGIATGVCEIKRLLLLYNFYV